MCIRDRYILKYFIKSIKISFLPRDDMLARGACCRRVSSVCPSATRQYCIETTGQIEVFFVLPPITHCVIRKFGNLQFGIWYFVPNVTASRSRCQHQQSSSSSSSTVKLVDDTYTTVDELWLFTTSRSTVTLQLHYCDLLYNFFSTVHRASC